jgi:predicted transcriptional regulator
MAKQVGQKRVPAHLWEILKNEREQNEPPKDTITVRMYAERFGITRSSAQKAIERLARAGILERVGQFGPKGEWHYTQPKGE